MALSSGTRLGPYEVRAPLGEGGMGEVYRARDTKLDRDVAIKVLPAAAASRRDPLDRFEREAKLLASLNHPNIAQVFGLEDADGSPAIVMELVEGDDLGALIASGPGLPIPQTLVIARQIADALEAAHEQGIVHRDLKPANIRLRSDGLVKLLDFGLAKLVGPESVPRGGVEPDAATIMSTEAGLLVGTVPYMSPEQARGGRVDRRTDIWAFGCVLYEMLAGRRAFTGGATSDVLAAILRADPDWSALPPDTPPSMRRLLRRALAKDERQRLQAIGDARIEIEQVASNQEAPAPSAGVRRTWAVAAAAAAFIAGCAATAAILWALTPAAPPPSVARLALPLPGIESLSGGSLGSIMTVSPDGRTIVFAGVRNGVHQLYRRPLDEPVPIPLQGTEGAQDPFFSPDGTRVGFAAGGKLKVIRLASDTPAIIVCDAPGFVGGTWGPDDTIVFGGGIEGLKRVPAAGGTPSPLTTLGPRDLQHGIPQFLPGGQAVLFYIDRGNDDVIATYSFADRSTRELLPGQAASYAPTGHVVVLRGDTLFAVPFDAASLRLTGEAVQLRERPRSALTGGSLHFAFGGDGSLAYVTPALRPKHVPAWVSPDGIRTTLSLEPAHYIELRPSPDGSRAVLWTDVRLPDESAGTLWVYDLSRRASLRLGGGQTSAAGSAAWSPDGRTIAYTGWVRDRGNVYVRAADATRPAEQLTDQPGYMAPQFWTADGRAIVLSTIRRGHIDLDLVRLDVADRTIAPLLSTAATESNAALSPDGRFMAYQSDESGRMDIHVRPFPGVDEGHWVVSPEGGEGPRWAPTGRFLYFRSGRRIVAVPIEPGPSFRTGEARVYLESQLTRDNDPRMANFFPERTFDIARDGTRMLMLQDAGRLDGPSAGSTIAIVQHWAGQLPGTPGRRR